MILKIELVPSTSWFNNLRSILKKEDWDKLRKETYKKAMYKCEICGGKGSKHPVECHEKWSYNDKKLIQKLDGLIALCPKCHMVKHIGFAIEKGNFQIAKEHFKKINNVSEEETIKYIENVFKKHNKRSSFDWKIDLKFLEDKNISLNN